MSMILAAKPVVQAIKDDIQQEAGRLKYAGHEPTLGIIRVGSRPDDVYYENSIIKNCQNLGLKAKTYTLAPDIGMQGFTEVLKAANADTAVHGILLFRPLPGQLDEDVIKEIIDPRKDIDGMSPQNLAKVMAGDKRALVPCTPAAVMETLRYYDIKLEGANVVILGRSMVVGRPLSMMLLQENATVTICHTRTKNTREITRRADIIIAAVGKAGQVDETYVTEDSVVIDVGINDAGNGKICGDVEYDRVIDKVRALTPVPGGIGSVTTAVLLKQVVLACKDQAI